MYLQGQGGMVSERLKQESPEPYTAVDPSYHLTAKALTRLAEKANEAGKLDESEQLALQGMARNITSGEPASHLLQLYASQKRSQQATEAASIAGKLWPAHTYTQTRLADYWARQQRLDKLIPTWNVLLTRNGSLHATIFPVLQQLLAQEEHKALFSPFIKKPPTWWSSFFNHLAQNAEPTLLNSVYEQRQKSKTPISKEERTIYVARLLRDQNWANAYQIWQTGISPKLLNKKNFIFDGGFEGDSFNSGFDWQISQTREISIKPDVTYGIKGKQAIHIRLKRDNPVHFQHLSQTLLLPADEYQLSMRYRLDTLKNPKGLRWRIHCLNTASTLLGESHALRGQKSWDTLNVTFSVPSQDCSAQRLRLEADSAYRHDHTFEGHLWFDDLAIQPITDKE
ncbi:MAG: hypothetical protein BWK73_44305 [Thiothrix lacustris]|uniref:CBM-cenC domain-containing protein n=1 Tax=Thiothrix lacustris TaxID=525917 RepID=A0A1Y1QBH1_9GAMM|nr:MAG: hypothetical protein BWK73_44305 [Thiothrix lacustris]